MSTNHSTALPLTKAMKPFEAFEASAVSSPSEATPMPITSQPPSPVQSASLPAYTAYHPYDGAIALPLPTGYIDASDIRQVPDHQALYLSPTTLTSVLIEINERADEHDEDDHEESDDPNHHPSDPDERAARTHFKDPVDTERGDDSQILLVNRVQLGGENLQSCVAWVVDGLIMSNNQNRDITSGQRRNDIIKLCMLLVRIPAEGTDLVVRIHMPIGELQKQGDEASAKEDVLVNDMMGEIVRRLDIKNWDLFG